MPGFGYYHRTSETTYKQRQEALRAKQAASWAALVKRSTK